MANPFTAAIAATAAWLGRIGGTAKSIRSQVSSGLRYQMRQGQPGQWASDHRAESEAFTGWNYIAIHALAKLVMRSAVQVYEPSPDVASQDQTTDDTTPVQKDNRYLKLLNRPNKYQSGASLRYERVVQLSLTGTAITWKVRNGFGLTVELYVIPTAVCSPVDPCREYPLGGFKVDPWGRFGQKDAEGFSETAGYKLAIGQIIDIRDCVIVRLPHPIVKGDGFSPTAACAPWIDTAKNLDASRWAQMHNGPDPSMLIEPPSDVTFESQSALDAYERKLNQKYGGPNNHGKIMVATHGKATPLSTNPKDMAYEKGFTQLADAILAAHGTSKAAIGMMDSMTYGSISAGIRAWVQLSCQPIASLLAEEDQEQISPEFGEGLTTEYLCPSIDDPDLIETQIATDITAGTITKGELRMLRGRPLFGDARDDQLAGQDAEQAGVVSVDGGATSDQNATAASDTALNGAQIDSLLSIVEQVVAGTLPVESARAVIDTAFPLVPQANIEKILAPLKAISAAGTQASVGTGEFSDISRQQLIRNRKAIDDVLGMLKAGTWNEARARSELQMIGLAPQTIDGLLSQPNDQAEIDAAAGQVSESTKTSAKSVHEHACVMAMLSPGLADDVLNVSRTIPKSALTDDGIESEPHVTIKWGLLPVSPRKIAKLLQSLDPLEFTIGKISVFEDDGIRGSDVVILEVTSEDATEAHDMLSEQLPHEEAKREYRPHITLAYVKPGKGEQFIGESPLTGQTFTVDRLVFSGVNGTRTVIPLANRLIDGESLYGSILDRMRSGAAVKGNGNGH